jgi:hypothetical protein
MIAGPGAFASVPLRCARTAPPDLALAPAAQPNPADRAAACFP